jgi:phosphatidylethanolamine/phosphatidyl-N-methylethanolamine N-methyltransferase
MKYQTHLISIITTTNMRINTNLWNKIRYTIFTPGYDLVAKLFNSYRKLSIGKLNIQPGESVLLVGAGTGLDLEFIPDTARITATDITPSMLDRLKRKSEKLGLNVQAQVMDGQQLQIPDSSFDHIILHLILAVIPDPVACIKEAERVLKPGGHIAIFDKFLPAHTRPGIIRKGINLITNLLATNINRSFEEIRSHTKLKIIHEMNAGFNGNFKIYTLEK